MYFLYDGKAQEGPFTIDQVQALLDAGQVTPGVLYWGDGMADWEPLDSAISPGTQTNPLSEEEFLALTMGYYQRRMYQTLGVIFILWIPLIPFVLLGVIHPVFRVLGGFLILGVLVYLAYCFLRFQAILVGWPRAVFVFIVVTIAPVLLPLRLIMSAFSASKKYRELGIKTDWLGVTPKELEHLKR
jgi:hypothetical protein